jgi:signal transduction histidine kinase
MEERAPIGSVSELLSTRRDRIIERWSARIAARPAREHPSRPALLDDLSAVLDRVKEAFERHGTGSDAVSRASELLAQAPSEVALERIRSGLGTLELAAEYIELGLAARDEVLAEGAGDIGALAPLDRALDGALTLVLQSRPGERPTVERRSSLVVGWLRAVLGHDLRGPMAVVLASARLARQRGVLDDKRHRSLDRIESAIGRMERMIDDLLDLAMAELGGGIALHMKPVDLEALVRAVLDHLRSTYGDRELELHVTGESLGEWDPERVRKVISNLALNALEHGRGTPVAVTVDARADPVVLEVHDDGPPLAPGEASRIFEPPDPRRSYSLPSAQGLGLMIAREVVLAHKGTIEVRSSEESGTDVIVRLPRRAA